MAREIQGAVYGELPEPFRAILSGSQAEAREYLAANTSDDWNVVQLVHFYSKWASSLPLNLLKPLKANVDFAKAALSDAGVPFPVVASAEDGTLFLTLPAPLNVPPFPVVEQQALIPPNQQPTAIAVDTNDRLMDWEDVTIATYLGLTKLKDKDVKTHLGYSAHRRIASSEIRECLKDPLNVHVWRVDQLQTAIKESLSDFTLLRTLRSYDFTDAASKQILELQSDCQFFNNLENILAVLTLNVKNSPHPDNTSMNPSVYLSPFM